MAPRQAARDNPDYRRPQAQGGRRAQDQADYHSDCRGGGDQRALLRRALRHVIQNAQYDWHHAHRNEHDHRATTTGVKSLRMRESRDAKIE